jgi:hypothetical protein
VPLKAADKPIIRFNRHHWRFFYATEKRGSKVQKLVWHLDKRVSVSHLITTILVIISVVAWSFQLQNKIENNARGSKQRRYSTVTRRRGGAIRRNSAPTRANSGAAGSASGATRGRVTMKWADIPVAAKWTSGAVATIASAVVWMFATFETAAQSEQKWSSHNQAISCRTVYDMQKQIRGLTEQMKFDTSLTAEQREWIKQQIDNIQAEIRRIDPNGVC